MDADGPVKSLSGSMDAGDSQPLLGGNRGNTLQNGAVAMTERNMRFWVLVTGIIFFFGLHNYMQELIMSLPGFKVVQTLFGSLIVLNLFEYVDWRISGLSGSTWCHHLLIY